MKRSVFRTLYRKIDGSGIFKAWLCAMLVLAALAFNVRAQDDEEEIIIDDVPLEIETLLFTIPVTVTDKTGRSITGLEKKNFSIYHEGEEQPIELFLNSEAPMNVAILLDTSFSTRKVLDKIQDAARDFVKILRPEDRAMIVGFDHRTTFFSTLTADRKVLNNAIKRTAVSRVGGSDMHSAILEVADRYFRALKDRKAVIVLTDGMVVTDRGITAQKVLDTLQETDTFFYPIIFRTESNSYRRPDNKKPATIEFLRILAEETAGKYYEKDATKLNEAFRAIAEELKKQYLLGFYPENTERKGGRQHIVVRVDQKGLIVQTKKRLEF
jgi:Ca-activated chloride channel family protein